MAGHDLQVRVHSAIAQIDAADWDACACPETADGGRPIDPFTTHRFLAALETSGSVGPGTGWSPRPMTVHDGDDMIGVCPMYVKGHSQGEYVFDFSWAHAYEQAGGNYYPKFQIAVPFTPATGRRFLAKPGMDAQVTAALTQSLVQFALDNQVSSAYATFCTEAEALAGEQIVLLHRTGQQFHWQNQGYGDFDAFLGALSSRKRKAIRKERKTASAFGGDIVMLTGDQIRADHWDDFWVFYQDTGARKWGSPYLTRAFFDEAHAHLREDMLLVLALNGGQPVAGALNFIGRDAIYGRYWGCTQHHPFLHFELCYYRAIDYAIAHGLDRVEAGAQGEHKLARGYLPTTTHSLHWLADARFREAVEEFLLSEKAAVEHDKEVLTSYGPFKHIDAGDDQ